MNRNRYIFKVKTQNYLKTFEKLYVTSITSMVDGTYGVWITKNFPFST